MDDLLATPVRAQGRHDKNKAREGDGRVCNDEAD